MRFIFFAFFLLACGVESENNEPDLSKCPKDIPQLPDPTRIPQETGYLKAGKGELFYWYFKAKNNPTTAPVAVWLNGGPGSSSLIGSFYENGPYRINPDLSIYEDSYSWNENAHMIYLEQPFKTGFSTGEELVQNEAQMADAVLSALLDFFGSKHPELKPNPFYLTGESFAGTYIPWIAERVLKNNNESMAKKIDLRGVLIIDGTIDRLAMALTYKDYALKAKLINENQYSLIEQFLEPSCERQMQTQRDANQQEDLSLSNCEAIFRYIIDNAGEIDIYDYRGRQEIDLFDMICYLNNSDVKQFIKVSPSILWKSNNRDTLRLLAPTSVHSTVPQIRSLLQNNIKVFILNGDKDIIVHHLGTEKWLDDLAKGAYGDFPGRTNFANLTPKKWKLDGQLTGEYKQSSNLLYALIYNAGHLLPADQPKAGKKLFEALVLGSTL